MKRDGLRRQTEVKRLLVALPRRAMRYLSAFWQKRLVPGGERNARAHGFTLVELLVVLAILGLLIALVAPAMIRQLGSAKHKIAAQSIERLSGILDLYRLDVGTYPSTAQGLTALNDNSSRVAGWNGPYLKDADGIVDPWGHPFQYRNPSDRADHPFDIVSLGADGKPGGDGENADLINR